MRLLLALGSVATLSVLAPLAASIPGRQAPAAASAAASAATARIVKAAEAFVATLDAAGRAKVQFEANSPQKSKWSNLPTGIYPRQGVRMGDLTPEQHKAAMAVLAAALSADGYRKIVEIVRSDEVLRTRPRRGRSSSAAITSRST